MKVEYDLLVIDKSNLTSDEAVVSALSKEGFRVASYSDHLEALSRLTQLKPDLIILGEGLPVDSFEVCQQLRQTLDTPIIILGNISRATGWVKAVQSGADCYLAKPIHHSELVARVKAILRRYAWNLTEE